MAISEKRVDYSLKQEIAITIFLGAGLVILISIIGTFIIGNDPLAFWGLFLVGVACVIGVVYKKININKLFEIKKGNEYTIEKVKEQFGTPDNVIKDGDFTYYTFDEGSGSGGLLKMAFGAKHIFTTNKKGIVIKHEIERI